MLYQDPEDDPEMSDALYAARRVMADGDIAEVRWVRGHADLFRLEVLPYVD